MGEPGIDPALLAASRFVAVFPWMLDAVEGDSTSALVLGYVQFITHRGTRWAPISVQQVMGDVGLSEKQARRGLDNIRRLGLVTSRRANPWHPSIEVALIVAGHPLPVADTPDVPLGSSREIPTGAPRAVPAGAPLIRKEEGEEVTSATQVASASLSPRGTSAQTILGAYIDYRTAQGLARMPRPTIGQLAKHIKEALEAGYSEAVITSALRDWHGKSYGPSSLPSFIDAAERQRNGGARRPQVAATITPRGGEPMIPADNRHAAGRSSGWA